MRPDQPEWGRSAVAPSEAEGPTLNAPAEEPWSLVVGQVVAPFGIKGEVRVRPETDFPERFRKLTEVRLELPSGEDRRAQVTAARVSARGVLVRLAGCESREQAEELRGAWIKVRPSMAAPLPAGSYYLHQILGLHAFTVDGRDLGEVTEVIRTGAHDVYVTAAAMIPALREVVREIDLVRGRMSVELPPEEGAQ